jgi:hypothetical protein
MNTRIARLAVQQLRSLALVRPSTYALPNHTEAFTAAKATSSSVTAENVDQKHLTRRSCLDTAHPVEFQDFRLVWIS